MKEYTMTSSLKNTMKSMEQTKKYYWSCKCSSFWHKLLEVEFIEFVRSVAEDLGIDGDNWDRLNKMGRSAAEDFQSPQNEQQWVIFLPEKFCIFIFLYWAMTCSANVLSDNMFTLRNSVELSIDLPEYPPTSEIS